MKKNVLNGSGPDVGEGAEMARPKILVLDDDQSHCELFKGGLSAMGMEVVCANDIASAEKLSAANNFDLFIVDLLLGQESGFDFLTSCAERDDSKPVIVASSLNDIPTLKKAFQLGAKGYVLKPFEFEELEKEISFCLQIPRANLLKQPRLERWAELGLVGESAGLLKAMKMAETAATSSLNVYIYGESGTGKELFARAIHRLSERANKPYHALNCGGMDEAMFNAELFGYKKGAFTGAETDKRGFIQESDGGTLFLDEIGDVSPHNQSKLLRVVESGTYYPLGDTRLHHSNVRYISATNHDLKVSVLENKFRLDLYYRLHGFQVEIPPLRERPEDIPLIVEKISARLPGLNGAIQLPEKVLELMGEYAWPGNIRQLENMVKMAAALSDGGPILLEHFPELLEWDKQRNDDLNEMRETSASFDEEPRKIRDALEKSRWNVGNAALFLGVSRATLYRKMKRWDIS